MVRLSMRASARASVRAETRGAIRAWARASEEKRLKGSIVSSCARSLPRVGDWSGTWTKPSQRAPALARCNSDTRTGRVLQADHWRPDFTDRRGGSNRAAGALPAAAARSRRKATFRAGHENRTPRRAWPRALRSAANGRRLCGVISPEADMPLLSADDGERPHQGRAASR